MVLVLLGCSLLLKDTLLFLYAWLQALPHRRVVRLLLGMGRRRCIEIASRAMLYQFSRLDKLRTKKPILQSHWKDFQVFYKYIQKWLDRRQTCV